ncbi:MAG: CHAT domain-containing protein [Saprospiraceae bacterium]|nr:CHAT domain-containing protein [Candidatus Vicinibacter affinis]
MKLSTLLFIFIIPLLLSAQNSTTSIVAQIESSRQLLEQKKPEESLSKILTLVKQEKAFNTQDSFAIYEILGACYATLNQFDKATQNYELAITKIFNNDTILAFILHQNGQCLIRLSQYAKATEQVLKSRDIYRKLFGNENKKYTGCLNTLGFLYKVQGKYSEAEKIFQEARQINFKLTGGEDLQYSRIINNLADVYSTLNRYDQADELYKTSLRIKEKLNGKQSLDYAKTLFNVANFQMSLGRYDKAKTTIKEAISIFTNLQETKHPDYLKFLDVLANIEDREGNYSEAERLYTDALKQRESSGLDKQAEYAVNLGNLGNLYLLQGKVDLALKNVEKARLLQESIYGKNHRKYASILVALANIQASRGENDKAQTNFEEASRIIQRSLGKDHIDNFNVQFDFAKFLRKIGKKSEAVGMLKRIEKIPRTYLMRAAKFLSEMELSTKLEEYNKYIHELYSFVRESPQEVELAVIAYNTSLFYRGFILNHLQKIRMSINKARKVSDSRDEVISLHRQLENELNKPLTERTGTAELERKISEIESEITHTIGTFSEDQEENNWEAVQLALGDEEAAVEYISFPDSRAKDTVFYGALILTKDATAPVFVELCSESFFTSFLKPNANRTSDYVNNLYEFSSRGAVQIEEKKGNLADLIWFPIRKYLPNVRKIFLVQDGLLNRINLSAIPTSLETVLADSVELILVGSTRQVILNDEQTGAYTGSKSLVVGGIDYDFESAEIVASRSSNSKTQGTATQQWGSLAWAEKESNEIVNLLRNERYNVQFINGKNAREPFVVDSLESKDGWRILHFATHGYFTNKSTTAPELKSGFYGSGMVNSGLVLTGANAMQFGSDLNTKDDGLLSAYEISHLDLSKTELVVLSACETALGDIKDMEGVYGLQRAFKLAGADKLIMSLWQVPDRETKDFMLSFYKNWILGKTSIREAFNKTQREARERFVNPYQWAGFVLLD